jgi:DNA ligase-associated metallophosphoesterase
MNAVPPGEGDLAVHLSGENLTLLPERALFWKNRGILFVADPHFGKAATFRAGGIPVPSGTTGDALDRLGSAVSRTNATTLVFLGDLLHAKAGRSKAMFDALLRWREMNSAVDLVLVRGNHDRSAGDPPSDLGIRCENSPHVMLPFVLGHHPIADKRGYVLAGHVHPGVRLYGAGRQRVRLPCFVFSKEVGILPAFGDFTGFADADPIGDAEVYAIADGCVVKTEKPRSMMPRGFQT